MMRRHLFATALVAVSLFFIGCSEDANDPEIKEFIAEEEDFVGYENWEQTTPPRVGVDPANILAGGAHGATDSNVTRSMFISPDGAQPSDGGQYPVGTLLAKEMKDSSGTIMMITAMAKRGNNYDPSGNDWEYLLLDASGSITDRGADLMNGMCKACHAGAAALDYVFTR